MQNGDISNGTPPRILVHVDVVVESEVVDDKKFLRTTSERKVNGLNRASLSQLWTLTQKYDLSVELIAYEEDFWTQRLLDELTDRLDRRGTNPFNYSEVYPDVQDLIKDLPYRTNLKGVIDLPNRVAMYGSWGVELNNL
jgi:hypothetical protein